MIRVSVLGATGYTGFSLVKLLLKHPDVEIAALTSESNPGEKYSDIYPALSGVCDITLTNDINEAAGKSDAVFMCLPHGASMDTGAALREKNLTVFDLSADYRLNDPELYKAAYNIEHRHKELLSAAVYGLAEIFTEEIKRADLIAIPGCYTTSALIPLIPLIRDGLVDTDYIIADCKSGVSGAGKKPTAITHFCEANEDFRPYGIFSHRHKPEIDHIIARAAGINTDVVFTPHLTPLNVGMLSTIYLKSKYDTDTLLASWHNAYNGRKAVRIRSAGAVPAVKFVANTPYIDIAMFKKGEKLIVVSALDNLMKGAASQALQCFNIRMGLNENRGLI